MMEVIKKNKVIVTVILVIIFILVMVLNYTKVGHKLTIVTKTMMLSSNYEDRGFVTYEEFGADGYDKKSDEAAIKKAHDTANEIYLQTGKDIRVESDKNATYYIGDVKEPIKIYTTTKWDTSTFIFDDWIDSDRNGKNDVTNSDVFEIVSNEKVITVKENFNVTKVNSNLSNLSKYISNKNNKKYLVELIDENTTEYIRKGVNENNGIQKKDYVVIDKNGTILSPLKNDSINVTVAYIYPVDESKIIISGGKFITYTNNKAYNCKTGSRNAYIKRGIKVSRSNVTVGNINHLLKENEVSHQGCKEVQGNSSANLYLTGFLNIDKTTDVEINNSNFQPHQSTKHKNENGSYVLNGSYDLVLNNSVNVSLNYISFNCDDNDNVCYKLFMLDNNRNNENKFRTRWGVFSSNHITNLTIKNSKLNRIDAHEGINNLTVENSTIGVEGVTMVGTGVAKFINTTFDSSLNMIKLRPDYGSTFAGEIILENVKWVKPNKGTNVFSYSNTKDHNYGYELHFPKITINNLEVINKNKTSKTYLYSADVSTMGSLDSNLFYEYNMPSNMTINKFKDSSDLEVGIINYTDIHYLNKNLYKNENVKTIVDVKDTKLSNEDILKMNQLNEIPDSKYTFNLEKKTGIVEKDGKKYLYDENGKMRTGLSKYGSYLYFTYEDGVLQTGFRKVGSKTYYFNGSNRAVTGFNDINGKKYFFGSDSIMKIGLFKEGSFYYYANEDGSLITGFRNIGGKTYYFNGSNRAVTGFNDINGKKYFFGSDFVMKTGLFKEGSYYYFGNEDGTLITGFRNIGGKTYYFNGSNRALTGMQNLNGKKYLFDSNYAYAKQGWVDYNNHKIYCFDDGRLAMGNVNVGGKQYYFDKNGYVKN